jgi:hypothetical protein
MTFPVSGKKTDREQTGANLWNQSMRSPAAPHQQNMVRMQDHTLSWGINMCFSCFVDVSLVYRL